MKTYGKLEQDLSGQVRISVAVGATALCTLIFSADTSERMLAALRSDEDISSLISLAACHLALTAQQADSEFGVMYMMSTLAAIVGLEESEGVGNHTDPNDLFGGAGDWDVTQDIPF